MRFCGEEESDMRDRIPPYYDATVSWQLNLITGKHEKRIQQNARTRSKNPLPHPSTRFFPALYM